MPNLPLSVPNPVSLPTPDDAALLARCRAGEAGAWDEIVSRYGRLVFSIARSYRLNEADAADVVQITFRILLQSIDRLAPDSRLGYWLGSVARRQTWRYLQQTRRESPEEEASLIARADALGHPGPRDAEHWELAEWINHGLAQIDARCRALLTRLYLDPTEPTYEDVAREFELPVGSIGPTRARCLGKVRAVLGAAPDA